MCLKSVSLITIRGKRNSHYDGWIGVENLYHKDILLFDFIKLRHFTNILLDDSQMEVN